jgi:hypothetical protein
MNPRWRKENNSSFSGMSVDQFVELITLLFEYFPPENDPKYEGAHSVTSDDTARALRDNLIRMLGNRGDTTAIMVLRTLEKRYQGKYDWLRRPRADAERAYRLSTWTPIPLEAIAALLTANRKRLIRSASEVMDGVIAAIEGYQQHLRIKNPNDLDDFWNRRSRKIPSPKEEEKVSDKLRDAIQNYFANYTVVANREVQLFRRKLPKGLGGAPGSEVDVFCTVPAVGTVMGDPIHLPIEVKLGHNPEARTGLQEQLVDRYMHECESTCGLFVVAWMGTKVSSQYRPLWQSTDAARKELHEQSTKASSTAENLDIRSLVIDLSLPVVSKDLRTNKARRRKGVKKGPRSTTKTKPRSKRSKAGR